MIFDLILQYNSWILQSILHKIPIWQPWPYQWIWPMELKIPGMQTQLNQWNLRVIKKIYKLDGWSRWTGLNKHHLIFWTSNSNTNELFETLYFLLLQNPWMNNQLIKQVIQEPGPCLGQAPVWFLILQTAREKGNQRSSAHVWIKDLHVSAHLLTILIIQTVHVAFIKARIQLLHIVSSIRMFSLNNFWKNKKQITSA